MPLSQPVERERLHTRSIEINGYRRSDGLYDIEAHLTDSKSFGQNSHDRGYIEPGEPIHDMWLRLTLDEQMRIAAVEAVSDKPHTSCVQRRRPTSPGWSACVSGPVSSARRTTRWAARSAAPICANCCSRWPPPPTRPSTLPRLGGRCWRRVLRTSRGSDALDKRITEKWGGGNKMLNTCLAYDEKGPLVKRRWPHLYTGRET